jgi:hypothetical protein
MDWLTIMLVAASGKKIRSPNSPNSWTIPAGSFTPSYHRMLAILPLNRAFFLGLNWICRRFRFIVHFSFLKTSKSQHFFQQGQNLRCLKSVQNLLSKSFLYFLPTRSNAYPAQEHYWVCNSCICSEIEIHCLWSRVLNTLRILLALWLGVTDRQREQCKVYLAHIVSNVQHQGFLTYPNFVS